MPGKAIDKGAAGLEMTALLSLEMEDYAERPLGFSVGQCEQAGQRVCRRIRLRLIHKGLGLGRQGEVRLVIATSALLMRGHLRGVTRTMPRLGQHEGGNTAAQDEGRGKNPAHHTDTNGPGRRSPAVTARRLAAVP
jgi:hypothetical protein